MMTAHWNTERFKQKFVSFGAKILHVESREDYTTDMITVSMPNKSEDERLFVRGFETGHTLVGDGSDVDVPFVEVTSGYSDGGCNSSDDDTLALYAKIVGYLRREGFSVVPTMDDYF